MIYITWDIITLSRERGCLSTGHFGEWPLREGNLQHQSNKRIRQQTKSLKIGYRVYYLL